MTSSFPNSILSPKYHRLSPVLIGEKQLFMRLFTGGECIRVPSPRLAISEGFEKSKPLFCCPSSKFVLSFFLYFHKNSITLNNNIPSVNLISMLLVIILNISICSSVKGYSLLLEAVLVVLARVMVKPVVTV